jgi:hypothetical protein
MGGVIPLPIVDVCLEEVFVFIPTEFKKSDGGF